MFTNLANELGPHPVSIGYLLGGSEMNSLASVHELMAAAQTLLLSCNDAPGVCAPWCPDGP
jgi:hypothetical protein